MLDPNLEHTKGQAEVKAVVKEDNEQEYEVGRFVLANSICTEDTTLEDTMEDACN